jgi:transposase-like protein
MNSEPTSLQQAIIYFSDLDNCVNFLVSRRWKNGVVVCPRCGSEKVTYMEARRLWQCKARHAKAQFSIKVGTIFEDSPLGLDKWLSAMWMIANCKNGVSSHEIASSLDITQKSAWHLMHRIRLAMKDGFTPTKIGGKDSAPVEVDETFVGGKIGNMHHGRAQAIRAAIAGNKDEGYESRMDNKTPVVGMFDRESRQVRAKVIPNVKRETLQTEILRHVKYGSEIHTDSAVAYNRVGWQYVHETVNHAERYVDGQVHTNSLENFWSLMKRNLAGTYVAVEPFHLDRYLDEQCFRFNNRINHTAASRFNKIVSQIVGRRLTYADLIGKELKKPAEAF